MRLEAWLDETPGETRGIVARDGRFERLIIHRETDTAAHRLGARSIGRASRVEPGLRGAFVELPGSASHGFLPLRPGTRVTEGQALEVEVLAEPRGGKGPTLRLMGPAEGPPRPVADGPSVRDWLGRWAPGVAPVEGVEAIQAGRDAEEEALVASATFPDQGLDIAVERTRALVAVDVDHVGGSAPAREAANRYALEQAARLIRLKSWGGLIVVDLAGAGREGDRIAAQARAAFAPDVEASIGPVSRFGLLQVALPWRRTPVEEILRGRDGRETAETRALAIVRSLRQALMSDTAAPRITARACPEEAAPAAPWVARLGPRAHLIADPAVAPGRFELD